MSSYLLSSNLSVKEDEISASAILLKKSQLKYKRDLMEHYARKVQECTIKLSTLKCETRLILTQEERDAAFNFFIMSREFVNKLEDEIMFQELVLQGNSDYDEELLVNTGISAESTIEEFNILLLDD